MSLIPDKVQEKPHVQDVADQVKKSNYAFVKSMAHQAEYNIKHCWQDEQHTPQEFFDQFGPYARASVEMNAALIALINKYEKTIGENFFNYAILDAVKAYIINEDGTITVK